MAGVPGQRTGGANKLPAALHRLRGTFRADKHGPTSQPLAAAAPAVLPPAPKGLSVASRALWRRIHREYDLTSTPLLELLESALRSRDVAERARAVLEAEGLTYTDSAGKPKAHPATTIHRDARAQFVSTLRVLGFPEEAD